MDDVGMTLDDLYNLPMEREEYSDEDKQYYDKAYELLRAGDTQGIFQFAGANITRCLVNTKPTQLEDLAAVNAIYRPGVIKMGALDKFINRRNGKEESKNDIHPLFDDILSPTEYIMIYQEQFIQMFNKLGLDFGKADIMRRMAEANDKDACRKYLEDNLYNDESRMVLSLKETRKVADKIIDGAGYLFNKSHALCYSQLAYWTAYMKARYPDRFSEVMFNHHVSDKDNLGITLTMAKRLLDNPKVSLGDINNFSKDYTVKDNNITIGLKSVKGIGDSVINKIIKYRPAGGWLTFQEFIQDNLSLKLIPFGTREDKLSGIQLLIHLGMFDNLPINGSGVLYSRKALCDVVDCLTKIDSEKKKRQKDIMEKLTGDKDTKLYELLGKVNLENLVSCLEIDIEEEYDEVYTINTEVEYVGFRLNEDEERQNVIVDCVKDMDISHIADFDDNNQEESKHFWSIIRSVESLKTKKGKPYANVRLDDGTSFRVWWNKLQYIKESLLPGKVIMIQLNSDTFGRSLSFSKNSFISEEDIIKLYKEVSR